MCKDLFSSLCDNVSLTVQLSVSQEDFNSRNLSIVKSQTLHKVTVSAVFFPARSHGNSYIFYEVANSYDLTRTNSYNFC